MIVVVDAHGMKGVRLGSLVDYIAMVSLTRVDPGHRGGATRTILGLFDAPGSEGAPAELTPWDIAFLKALYRTEQSNADYRGLIEASMGRELGTSPP